jgi:hypothetical protein
MSLATNTLARQAALKAAKHHGKHRAGIPRIVSRHLLKPLHGSALPQAIELAENATPKNAASRRSAVAPSESPETQNQEHNAGADLQHLECSALGRLKRHFNVTRARRQGRRPVQP